MGVLLVKTLINMGMNIKSEIACQFLAKNYVKGGLMIVKK